MVKPVVGGVRDERPGWRSRRQRDLAMDVLQYGMALVAIVAVTLLAVIR
jgi:hypothetical protein